MLIWCSSNGITFEESTISMTIPDHFRHTYLQKELHEKDLLADPLDLFSLWWEEAVEAIVLEVNAMTLATVNKEGQPSARIVLLKGLSKEGLEFYTNYDSRKAQEMEENPQVALLFFWKELERQVRIEGMVEKVSEERSRVYFQSRPRSSQIGAWASPQSKTIHSRQELYDEVERLEKEYEGQETLPLPPQWGGYLVRPSLYEFWQGRDSRLHDRFRYRMENGEWRIERLAP